VALRILNVTFNESNSECLFLPEAAGILRERDDDYNAFKLPVSIINYIQLIISNIFLNGDSLHFIVNTIFYTVEIVL
jgi:hypothetical protein